ncbi:Major capsid protein [Trichinella pseudospiralis]
MVRSLKGQLQSEINLTKITRLLQLQLETPVQNPGSVSKLEKRVDCAFEHKASMFPASKRCSSNYRLLFDKGLLLKAN